MLIYHVNVLLFSSEINSLMTRGGKDNIAKGIDLLSQRQTFYAKVWSRQSIFFLLMPINEQIGP